MYRLARTKGARPFPWLGAAAAAGLVVTTVPATGFADAGTCDRRRPRGAHSCDADGCLVPPGLRRRTPHRRVGHAVRCGLLRPDRSDGSAPSPPAQPRRLGRVVSLSLGRSVRGGPAARVHLDWRRRRVLLRDGVGQVEAHARGQPQQELGRRLGRVCWDRLQRPWRGWRSRRTSCPARPSGRGRSRAGIGVVLGVGAIVGDLVESLLKREAGVKDSGSIFPGHGGVLDRLDALARDAAVELRALGARRGAALIRVAVLGSTGVHRAQHARGRVSTPRALPRRGVGREPEGRRAAQPGGAIPTGRRRRERRSGRAAGDPGDRNKVGSGTSGSARGGGVPGRGRRRQRAGRGGGGSSRRSGALEAGHRLALANKESLVAGGPLVLQASGRGGAEIVPIDSEHSAILQCLEGYDAEMVCKITLTASGGPFRGRNLDDLAHVRPSEALNHPTWGHGGEDHHRFGDSGEQGSGGH